MGNLKAEFLGAGFDNAERRLIRAFAIGAMADDGLETECLDLIEIIYGNLAGYRVFIVDRADIDGSCPL